MGHLKSNIGTFLTRRMAAQTVRQRHMTGPQYNKRKFFSFNNKYSSTQHRREPALHSRDPRRVEGVFRTYHRHLPGDVQTKPEQEWGPIDRADRVTVQWRKRGRLQLHQMGSGAERFVCYRCGYPVKGLLMAVLDDNWDYRMCYSCYNATMRTGMEDRTS